MRKPPADYDAQQVGGEAQCTCRPAWFSTADTEVLYYRDKNCPIHGDDDA